VHRHFPALIVGHARAHGNYDTEQYVREGLHHVGCTSRLELELCIHLWLGLDVSVAA
jgi:hypothetical protein